MSQLPLFVFGTLRRGHPNHRYLAEAYDRCLAATLREFRRMIAPHGFPSVIRSPLARVQGELYFIRPDLYEETLRQCDLLEDLPPGQLIGKFYRRMPLTVETAEGPFDAWGYVDPSTV